MSLNDQIAQGGNPFNPIQTLAQVNQLQSMGQERQLRDQQMQAGKLSLEQAQLQFQRAKQSQQAAADSFDPNGKFNHDTYLQKLYTIDPQKATEYQSSLLSMRKAQGDLSKQGDEHSAAEMEYAGGIAGQIRASGYDPRVTNALLAEAVATKPEYAQHAQQLATLMQQNPQQFRQVIDSMWSASKSQQEAYKAGKEGDKAQFMDAGGVPNKVVNGNLVPQGPMTPADEATAAVLNIKPGTPVPLATAEKAKQTAAAGVDTVNAGGRVRVFNKTTQKLGADLGQANGLVTLNAQAGLLTPEAVQMAGQNYQQTGQLPAGMRSPSMSAQVLNSAAKNGPVDIASNKANYAANSASLKKLQENFDQVSAFENTAGKNLDVFLNQAKKLVDSGSPILNSPLRMLTDKVAGSENMAAVNTARTTALTEIAKVLNSSNASGVLSDSARTEVNHLIGPDATLKQIYAAANILKQDMANRHQSYADQIKEIKGRMQGGSNGQSAPAATQPITIKLPSGKTVTIN